MTSSTRFASRFFVFSLVAAAVALSADEAYAVDITWSGTTSGYWDVAGNWRGDVIPGSSGGYSNPDTATFTGTSNTAVTVDAYRNIKSITFDASAGAFTLSGGTLQLTTGGAISNVAATAQTETIDSTIVINDTPATYTFTNNATNNTKLLNFSGGITGGTPSATVVLTLSGANTGANTISGIIGNGKSTSVAITKAGAGTWVLSGANTYTGPTTVNAGILRVGIASVANTSGALGINSAVTLANTTGVALDIAGYDTQIGSIAGGGANGGNVTLGSNTLTVGGNNTNAQYSGVISSSPGFTGVSLNKIGTGSLNINNANNSFTGNIVIDGGTLEYGVNGHLGATPTSPRSNNISILNGGTLYDDNGTDDGANLGANRGIYLGPGNQNFRSQSGDWHIGGVISGPGGIYKTRAGGYSRLYLDATNTFTGDSYFNGNGSTDGYGGIQINTPLAVQYSALDTTSVGSNFGAGSSLICGGLVGNGAFGNGGITGGTLNSITMQPQIVGLTKLYTGVLSGAAGMTLTKDGPGIQALNGLNTYSGATTIKAGVLSINTIKAVSGGSSSLGAPITAPNGTIAIGNLTTGATLVYTGSGDTTDRVINLTGTTGGATLDQSGSGTLTFSSALTATGSGAKTLTLQGSTTGTGVLGGAIVDSSGGATSLTKTGTGGWTLNAANTYTGNTTFNGGTLTIGNNLALQNSALNYTTDTLAFSAGINTPTFGGLTGSTSLSVASNVTTLTLDPATGLTRTYSGSLGSDLPGMNLAMAGVGTGTQVLGAATYTGATAVNSGKLYLNGSNATTAISVAGLATLGGTGTAASATATVASTGIVEAGYSGAGTLTLGGLTFGSSTTDTATVKIANFSTYSSSPALNVTNSGGLAVNGNAGTITIALTSGIVPASGTAHLIQYNNPIVGTGAGFSAFTLNTAGLGAGPRALFGLVDNITGSPTNYVDLNYSTDYPLWSGAADNTWITSGSIVNGGGSTNWVLNSNHSTTTTYTAGDAVLFNDFVGAGTKTVNISAADVAPASVRFDNTTGTTYTLTGAFNGGTTYGIADISGGTTALTKSNLGTLIVANNNTYSGGTTISGGTLQVGNGSTIGNLGTGPIHDNATLTFDRSDTITPATISGTGSLIQNGSGTLELNGANSYQSGTTLNHGTLKLGSATALGTGTLTINGCALDSGVASLVLTNDNVQVWNSDFSFAGTNALNLGTGAVSLGSTAGARTVTVDASTLTVGGKISDGTATALHKAGTGALVLGGANDYSGGTTVNAGTITVNNLATLGATTGPLAVNNPNSTGSGTDVVLNLNGNVSTGSLSGAIATPTGGTNTATINIASGKTYTVTQTTDGVYAGTIAGTNGKLVKDGGSKLTLSGANSYTGGTQLDDGTLSVNTLSDTDTSALGNSGGITLNGGTFQYTGHAAYSTNRFAALGGAQTFDITQSDANLTVTATYNSGTITKVGAGTLTFGGNVGWDHENYGNGSVTVENGTMVLDANVYTTGGNNPLFHAMFLTVNDVQSPATLKLGTTYNNIKLNFANTFHMSGGIYDINGMANNGSAQIDGSGTITNNGAADATVNVFANLTNAFSGNIVDGTSHKTGLQLGNVGGFGASGAAVWTLSGNNTYTGATTVDVGTLKAGSATAFSPNSVFTVGATLDLAGFNNTIAGLTGGGTVKSSTGSAILTVNNDVATSNADYTFGGVLRDGTVPEGGGTLGLTKTGSKILTISGANTYTGGTRLDVGTLTGNGASPLGATTGTLAVNNPNTGAGTNVVLNLSTTAATTTGSLSGTIATAGTGTNTATINNGGQLFTVNQTANAAYAGVIAGNGGFTLGSLSTHTLTLSGNNTYNGATTVSQGTLKLVAANNNNIAISSSINIAGGAVFDVEGLSGPNLALASGQTLMGNGTVTGGSVAVGTGAILAPGDRTLVTPAKGTLTIQNAVVLTGGTTDLRLFSTTNDSDKLVQSTTGTITFGGVLNVTESSNFTGPYASGNSWDLFDWIGTPTGAFSTPVNLPILSSGLTWNTTSLYTNGTISIVPTASPIPQVAITTTANTRVLAGTSKSIDGTYGNSGTASLTATLADNSGTLTLASFSPSGSQTVDAGTINQPFTGSIANVGAAGIGKTFNVAFDSATASGTLDVVNQRTFTDPSTIDLGRVLLGIDVPTGKSGNVTSTGQAHNDTADSTPLAYGGAPISGLSLSGGGVKLDGTTTSSTYTLSGTVSGTAGSTVGGTFNLNATDEFGNNLTSVASVAFTGTAVGVRTVSTPTTTDLGTYHAGAAVSRTSNTFGGTYGGGTGVTADTENATLSYTGSADANGINLNTGDTTLTTPTGTRSFSGTAAIDPSSSRGGSFSVGVSRELSGPASSVPAAYTIGVYSGKMVWGGATGTNNWNDGTKWTDSVSGGVHAAPGLDGVLSNTDTATFVTTGSAVTVNLNGATPSLNAMTFNSTGTGSYTVAGSGGITLVSAESGLAEIHVDTGSHTISANINPGSVYPSYIKSGTGTLTLSGTNGFFANIYVDKGTLVATKPGSLNTDYVGMGYAGPATVAVNAGGSGEWASGDINTLLAKVTVEGPVASFGIDTTGGNFTHAFPINNPGGEYGMGLTKLGANKLTLTGASTYTGATLVSGGALLVNNSTGSGTGTGAVTVGVFGTLGGTGTIKPTGDNAISISGLLAPGASIGTLTFDMGDTTGKVEMLSGSTLSFELGAPGNGDLVKFYNYSSGDFTLTGNLINFTNAGGLAPGTYKLFDFYSDTGHNSIASGITSGLTMGTGLDSYGSSLVYNNTNISLIVTAIPEPSTLILLGMAVLGLLVYVWRKPSLSNRSALL